MTRNGQSTQEEHQLPGNGPVQWPLGVSVSVLSPPDWKELKAAGIGCVELTWQARKNDLPWDEELRRQCEAVLGAIRDEGISIWTLHIPYGHDWDLSLEDESALSDAYRKVVSMLTLAQQWHVPRVILHPSYEPVPADRRDRRLAICKESLRRLGQEAESRGVTIALECLPRTCLGNSADEMELLVGAHPGLRVCVDVNHLFKETPEQFIRRLGPCIVTTHISDNDGNDEKHWMPGEGVLNWSEIGQALEKVGYGGPFLYEVRSIHPPAVRSNYDGLLERWGSGTQG